MAVLGPAAVSALCQGPTSQVDGAPTRAIERSLSNADIDVAAPPMRDSSGTAQLQKVPPSFTTNRSWVAEPEASPGSSAEEKTAASASPKNSVDIESMVSHCSRTPLASPTRCAEADAHRAISICASPGELVEPEFSEPSEPQAATTARQAIKRAIGFTHTPVVHTGIDMRPRGRHAVSALGTEI